MFRHILLILAAALVHMTPALCVAALAIHTPTDSTAYLVACYVFMALGVWGIFKFQKYAKIN